MAHAAAQVRSTARSVRNLLNFSTLRAAFTLGEPAKETRMSAVRSLFTAACNTNSGSDTDDELLRRFDKTRDNSAFETLVRRHSRLVWGVCHRILGHIQEAEDAFQATFLVLARDPSKSRRWGSTSGFLYGVARRVSLKARQRGVARAARLGNLRPSAASDPIASAAARELQSMLDQEIERLPGAYRAVFIECVLNGKSRSEAASELGIKEGTLSARLARARLLLRTRLARRGVQLAGAIALTDLTALAAPSGLVSAAIRTGVTDRSSPGVAALLGGPRLRWMIVTAVGLVASAAVAMGLTFAEPTAHSIAPPASPEQSAKTPPVLADGGDELPTGSVGRLGSTHWRHEGEAQEITFSQDGKTLAVKSMKGGNVTLFETATGQVVHRFSASDGFSAPLSMAFSPDGALLATQHDRSTVLLWDTRTNKHVRTFRADVGNERPGVAEQRSTIQFSRDGKLLVFQKSEKLALSLWDLAQGTEVGEVCWERHGNPTFSLSPDGKIIALSAANPAIQLYDTGTGKFLHGFDPAEYGLCLTFSPDGKTIATGGKSLIVLSDVATGKEQGRMAMKQVLGVAYTPDGKRLVAMGEDGKIRIWNVETCREGLVIDGRGWLGRSMALSADGNKVALGTVYNVVRVWDVNTGKEISTQIQGHDAPIRAVTFSPDGRSLVTGTENHQINLWDPATLRCSNQIRDLSARQLSISPDGKRFVSAWDHNKKVQVSDVARGEKLLELGPLRGESTAGAAFTDNGKSVITVSWKWNGEKPQPNTPRCTSILQVWEAESGKPTREVNLPGVGISVLATSPDRNWAAVGGLGEARLWLCDLRRGREHPLGLKACDFVQRVAFSPDGRILASAGYEREPVPGGQIRCCIRLWEVTSGREIAKLVDHSGTSGNLSFTSMGGLAFTPDGRVLVSADCGGMRRLDTSIIRFWDVVTGRDLAQIEYKASSIASLAVAPEGNRFVTGLENGTALVWEIPAAAKPPAEARARKLVPKEVAALWEDLASDDSKVAHEAVRILASSPEQSVPFLAKSLRPAGKIDLAKVRQRITELGDEDFNTREAASRELKQLGEDIEKELQKGLVDNPSAEAVRRIQSILSAVGQSPPPARLQELRGVWVLELIGTPQAKEILAGLRQGDPNARLTHEAKAAIERR